MGGFTQHPIVLDVEARARAAAVASSQCLYLDAAAAAIAAAALVIYLCFPAVGGERQRPSEEETMREQQQ